MKKNTPGEVSLTASEIQAIRLNKLEYRRLQRDINILQGDLHVQLARLQKQAKGLKYHLKNVVQVVKPNHPYQLWKQAHAYEIAQDSTNKWIGLMISIFLDANFNKQLVKEIPFYRIDRASYSKWHCFHVFF